MTLVIDVLQNFVHEHSIEGLIRKGKRLGSGDEKFDIGMPPLLLARVANPGGIRIDSDNAAGATAYESRGIPTICTTAVEPFPLE